MTSRNNKKRCVKTATKQSQPHHKQNEVSPETSADLAINKGTSEPTKSLGKGPNPTGKGRDNDGDKDIIVGNRIQTKKYPIHEPSIIYENRSGKLLNLFINF